MFRERSFRTLCFLAIIVPFLDAPSARGQSTHYEGPDNGDWAEPDNWTNGVPSADLVAIIHGTHTVYVASPAQAEALDVDDGAELSVYGDSTLLTVDDSLNIGEYGSGTLSLTGGTIVGARAIFAAYQASGSATVTIDGSTLLTTDPEADSFGTAGAATLTITNGGVYNTNHVSFGSYYLGSTTTVTVTGAGSQLNAGDIKLAPYGRASLTLSDGGKVNVSSINITDGSDGAAGNVRASVTITGTDSEFTVNNSQLVIGSYDDETEFSIGSVTIADGGTLTVKEPPDEWGNIEVRPHSRLQIGDGGAAGHLDAGRIHLGGKLVFNHSDDIVFDAVIADSLFPDSAGLGSIIKKGDGTLTLTRNNPDFTGAIDVREGRLFVNANMTHTDATVRGTGILGGEAILADLTVSDGGTISPGDGIGTMLVDIATWGEDGTYLWEISSALGEPGEDWDLFNAYYYLSVGATSDNPFTIEIVSDGLADFDPTQSYSWIIFTSNTVPILFDEDVFRINASRFADAPDSSRFSLSLNGTDIVLTYSAVPEPAEWGLLGALALLAIALRRRSSPHSAA